jgi:hypothetical protein|tara:strand:+ start:517 stop:891 length:375 start_codon:yes stop_codon:yes gene_type:complete
MRDRKPSGKLTGAAAAAVKELNRGDGWNTMHPNVKWAYNAERGEVSTPHGECCTGRIVVHVKSPSEAQTALALLEWGQRRSQRREDAALRAGALDAWNPGLSTRLKAADKAKRGADEPAARAKR